MAKGDHIYYFRGGGTYSHHGIDCGDGTVVHFETSPWQKLAGGLRSGELPQVARTSLEEFALGHSVDEILVRDYDVRQIDHARTTLERAESRLGEEGYSVFNNNCEHFAVWCKTGMAESSQVNAHRKAAESVVLGSPVGAVLFRVARRLPGRLRGIATLGAVGVAGAVYVATYMRHRMQNGDSALL